MSSRPHTQSVQTHCKWRKHPTVPGKKSMTFLLWCIPVEWPFARWLTVPRSSNFEVNLKQSLVHTKLDKIFSAYGIPNVAKSDNGPPVNNHEFKDFVDHMGFEHHKITPYWPQANVEAERFMRTLEKSVRAAQVEVKPWKKELYVFLRNYRATLHSSKEQSPATVLLQRSIRTKLLEIGPSPSSIRTSGWMT